MNENSNTNNENLNINSENIGGNIGNQNISEPSDTVKNNDINENIEGTENVNNQNNANIQNIVATENSSVNNIPLPQAVVTEEKEVVEEKEKEYSPMEERKEVPKPKSNAPLIIFFVIVFAFILFLPTISDYINEQKEEQKIEEFEKKLQEEEKLKQEQEDKEKQEQEEAKEEEKKEEEQYKKLTCTSVPADSLTQTTTTVQELTYSNDQLKIAKVTKTTLYKTVDTTYQEEESRCINKPLQIAQVSGYEFSCSQTEMTIEETNIFDLKDFKSATITYDNGKTETIDTAYQYNQSVKEITDSLGLQGYTCS